MLYLGIDQHARQITISLRDENGDILLARQVSTQPAKIHAFFQQLTRRRLAHGESFTAVLEVCGFNEWLIRMLKDYRCHKVILIQPEERKKQKTDRRDAAVLSELLWVNRARLLQGKPVRGLRQVDISSTTDQENRRLTTLRQTVSCDPCSEPERKNSLGMPLRLRNRNREDYQVPSQRRHDELRMCWKARVRNKARTGQQDPGALHLEADATTLQQSTCEGLPALWWARHQSL